VIPNEEAKDENQKHLCFANLILCPHYRLFASLMIPNEEAKDENQKHLCCANLILCPFKNSLKRRAAWTNFFGA
jgi:hypothetical protein